MAKEKRPYGTPRIEIRNGYKYAECAWCKQFCPEFEPDWNDHDTPKIAVHFDCEKDKMVSTCTYSEKSVYEVYFDSFETADKVAAILNREVVK